MYWISSRTIRRGTSADRARRCWGLPQNSPLLTFDRRDIAAALLAKGFRQEARDHAVYWLIGTPTEPVWTKLSRGKEYRTLGPPIVSKIRRQLKLSKKQLSDFVHCRMTKDKYLEHLRAAKILPRKNPRKGGRRTSLTLALCYRRVTGDPPG